MHLVVTDHVGAGKTSWCRRYIDWLSCRKVSVGGILCLGTEHNGTKIGYEVLDIRTNERRGFARLADRSNFIGESAGRFIISHDGLAFAIQAIRSAIEQVCDLVFIDEVGHLELSGKGLLKSAKLAYRHSPSTVTVVRKVLLSDFLSLMKTTDNTPEFVVLDISSEDTVSINNTFRAFIRNPRH
jgi:nucleoside-triphosphatase THEP1